MSNKRLAFKSLMSCNSDISTNSSLFLHCSFSCLCSDTLIANSSNFPSWTLSCESMWKRNKICTYHSCVQQPEVVTLSLIQTVYSHFTRPTDRQDGHILHFSADQWLLVSRNQQWTGYLALTQWTNIWVRGSLCSMVPVLGVEGLTFILKPKK